MLLLMMLVHSWKARGPAVACHYEVFHLRRLRHIGRRPAVLNPAGWEVCPYSAARRVRTRRRRPLRNQVGDTVRTHTALCMLRLLLLVVCDAHRFCTVALGFSRISWCYKLRVADPPDLCGNLLILRPVLQLYNSTLITDYFRHKSCVRACLCYASWIMNFALNILYFEKATAVKAETFKLWSQIQTQYCAEFCAIKKLALKWLKWCRWCLIMWQNCLSTDTYFYFEPNLPISYFSQGWQPCKLLIFHLEPSLTVSS